MNKDSLKSNITPKKYKTKKMKNVLQSKDDSDSSEKSKEVIKSNENKYDVNMTIIDDNTIKTEIKKQDEIDEGDKALKDILKPKISESFQEEINKLEDLIKLFKNHPIPDDDKDKDKTISHLKNVISILMQQSQNLIPEWID